MFKFRLEKILSLKEKIEEAKKNEYAKARKRLEDAINKAYENVNKVSFANAFYRKDIGAKALSVLK